MVAILLTAIKKLWQDVYSIYTNKQTIAVLLVTVGIGDGGYGHITVTNLAAELLAEQDVPCCQVPVDKPSP